MAEVRYGGVLVLASGLTVKLAGVEVPGRDDPYARESRAALARLVDGKTVRLFYGGPHRDDFCRASAQVRLAPHGTWIEGALVEAGAARARAFRDNRAMARPLLDLEARARAKTRGLWALPAYRVLLPGEAARAEGFQIVEGRVRRADDDRGLWLDFGEDGGGFAAQAPARAAQDFAAAGLAPAQVRGRLARVRGFVGADGRLRLDNPESVELLNES